MEKLCFVTSLALLFPVCFAIEQATVGELFTFKIEPLLFNWTNAVVGEQFKYRPSLAGYPDVPTWMRYMYSQEYHAGFLYGTPPDRLSGKKIHLDIVALNKQNYETRKILLSIYVTHKFPTPNVVQMKIDNLNWVHIMDPGRVENLRNIFRKDLWPESDNDLSLVFMESAVNMGGRLPLRPQQREGVIVHLGSFAQFSTRLKELQEEVRPLYKLASCTYKRTSVQKIFESAGFKLDWCAFKMVGTEVSPEILFHNHGMKGYQGSELSTLRRSDHWYGMARDDVPQRNYIDEFAFAFAIPGMIFAVLLGILSAVLCFQHEKFDINTNRPSTSSTVQMVQCSNTNTNQPVTTLKSLKDPNFLLDNVSMHSQSPNNSIYPNDSPSNTYLRPNPPPYKGVNGGKKSVDI